MDETFDNQEQLDSSQKAQTSSGDIQMALVGNANVGKSVIFGLVTGKYVIVSNYPGTTVEVSKGTCRGFGNSSEVVDTPGVNSLIPLSEDERVTRDIVLNGIEKIVVQVVDSKNLRRGMMITSQLAELNQRVVIDLNMWDESLDRGISIDTVALKKILGVPVIKTVATQKKGINSLINSVNKAEVPKIHIDYGVDVEDSIKEIDHIFESNGIEKNRGVAIMILADDDMMESHFRKKLDDAVRNQLIGIREKLKEKFNAPVNYVINTKRAGAVDDFLDGIIKTQSAVAESNPLLRKLFFFLIMPIVSFGIGYKFGDLVQFVTSKFTGLSDCAIVLTNIAVGVVCSICLCVYLFKNEYHGRSTLSNILGRLAMHPVVAMPLLMVILWLTYKIVGVFGAGTCVDFIESKIFGDAIELSGGFDLYIPLPFTDIRWDLAHVDFQGINYYIGWLAQQVMSRDNIIFELFLNDQSGLIRIGVTYSIAIVFPIVGFFFLIFGLMEDSGYLPRLAIMVDRVLKKIGLNGKAVLPLVLGLGCATMATLTTRILDTKKERTISVLLLALGVPCSAQLGVIAIVLGRVSGLYFVIYALIIFSQLLLVGYLASKTIKGTPPDFMIEIPPFRFPGIYNVFIKTIYRIQWFMKEAIPLFVLGTFILFIITKIGVLSILEKAAGPIVEGVLGLPASTAQGFILGFLRRDYGALSVFKELEKSSDTGSANPGQLLIALVVITLFVPCLANFFVMVKEQGTKNAFLMVAFILPFSVAIGGVINLVLKLVT